MRKLNLTWALLLLCSALLATAIAVFPPCTTAEVAAWAQAFGTIAAIGFTARLADEARRSAAQDRINEQLAEHAATVKMLSKFGARVADRVHALESFVGDYQIEARNTLLFELDSYLEVLHRLASLSFPNIDVLLLSADMGRRIKEFRLEVETVTFGTTDENLAIQSRFNAMRSQFNVIKNALDDHYAALTKLTS